MSSFTRREEGAPDARRTNWMRSLGYTIPQIVQAAGETLSANYQILTVSNTSAYQELLVAVSGLSVTSDNPFAS